MGTKELKSMSVDELWRLHEELVAELSRKIATEKAMLEQKLRKLGFTASGVKPGRARRPYRKISPKYSNPDNPAETWTGRGKRPRWLCAQLRSGKKLDQFRIKDAPVRAED